MAAPKTTHKERQGAAIVASLDILAAHPFTEILTAEEERGLAAGLGALREFAATMGCIDEPLGAWSKEQVMRFLAMAVRAAVPLRSLPDHESFREFSDDCPF